MANSMTDKKKEKPRARAKAPTEQKAGPAPGGRSLSGRLWVAARALYEGDLLITYKEVAEEFGISAVTVKRRGLDERWSKSVDHLPKMTERAHHLADQVKTTLADHGLDLSDAVGKSGLPPESVQAEISAETGAEVRAKLLTRHRGEWAAPRALAYDAMKLGKDGDVEAGFTKAKLAKISTEILLNIQNGERKAWGLDKGDVEEKVTVVIERS